MECCGVGVGWGGGSWGDNNGNGAERRTEAGVGPSPHHRHHTPVAAALPGLANAPREAALDDRGFAVEGLAEFWAAAAAAAKVARFCNCRALIPGERSQKRVVSNLGSEAEARPGGPVAPGREQSEPGGSLNASLGSAVSRPHACAATSSTVADFTRPAQT